jgi:hypothetical protein
MGGGKEVNKIRVEWIEQRPEGPMWKSLDATIKTSRKGNIYFELPQALDKRVCIAKELRTGSEVLCKKGAKWEKAGRVVDGGRGVFIGVGPTFREHQESAR